MNTFFFISRATVANTEVVYLPVLYRCSVQLRCITAQSTTVLSQKNLNVICVAYYAKGRDVCSSLQSDFQLDFGLRDGHLRLVVMSSGRRMICCIIAPVVGFKIFNTCTLLIEVS